MNRSRKLAAIMFTDMQGYTALMQQNEEKAIQARDKHRKIFNSTTEKYNGTILQYYGDGTLSIFDSAIDAVECGIEMQLAFQQEPAILVRIGIHQGDVILKDDEIIGDGVNIASRIESLAVSGSVFISEKVYDEIKNQESINATWLKMVKLKNVAKPMSIYAISNEGLLVPEAKDIKGKTDPNSLHRSSVKKVVLGGLVSLFLIAILVVSYLKFYLPSNQPSLSTEKSIAVLAFKNMSSDPNQEYFSDGISEEILNSLVHMEGLKVAGRTSSFSFKDKNEDIRSIGKKLDVKMVLEGSVRKDGNQIRVTAQLINVEDGFHIWSETYDREMKDIFSVQEDIANRIVKKLKLQVQMLSSDQGGTQNLEAYDLFLKGIYFHSKDFLSAEKAMESFEKAVELDLNYAKAYALISEMYIVYAGYGLMPPTEAYAKAREAAQKAISINSQEPRAHKALAYVYFTSDWDWEQGLSQFEKAVQYGLPVPDQFMTYYDVFIRKDYESAILASEKMAKSDPLNIESHWHLGLMRYFSGNYKESLNSFNTTLELDPNYSEGHRWRGVNLGYLGEFEEAQISLTKALEISQGQGPANFDMQVLKIQMGKTDEVLKTLNEWEKSGGYLSPIDPAMLYALLGMPDKAIYWLEKSYQERAIMIVSLKFYWVWDNIRDDPRFKEIYSRMKFPK